MSPFDVSVVGIGKSVNHIYYLVNQEFIKRMQALQPITEVKPEDTIIDKMAAEKELATETTT